MEWVQFYIQLDLARLFRNMPPYFLYKILFSLLLNVAFTCMCGLTDVCAPNIHMPVLPVFVLLKLVNSNKMILFYMIAGWLSIKKQIRACTLLLHSLFFLLSCLVTGGMEFACCLRH
jgi:hypothetical protein